MADGEPDLRKQNLRLERDLRRLEKNMKRLEDLQLVQDRVQRALQNDLDAARARAKELLLNILPGEVVQRLDAGERRIADHYDSVTILFSDFVGFTPIAERLTSAELVGALDLVFSTFDRLSQESGVEKIKTVGDSYMAVAGLGDRPADHADRAGRLALSMRTAMVEMTPELPAAFAMRVGVHSGPVTAGVIGTHKFSYDVWGDAVNTASRMESSGEPGRIQVSADTAALLGAAYRLEARGPVEVKGKGEMETFWLVGGPTAP